MASISSSAPSLLIIAPSRFEGTGVTRFNRNPLDDILVRLGFDHTFFFLGSFARKFNKQIHSPQPANNSMKRKDRNGVFCFCGNDSSWWGGQCDPT